MNDVQYDNTSQAEIESTTSDPISKTDARARETDTFSEASEEALGESEAVFETTDSVIDFSEDPCADPDPDPGAADPKEQKALLDELRNELTALKNALDAARERNQRTEREYAEFCELYPNVPLDRCNDNVWRAVESGIPLAAAYALEERKNAVLLQRADKSNARNKERSVGKISDTQNEFFTPDEVRSMTAHEVRSNLSKIMLSMKEWSKLK